jgi:hypothetical protein
MEKVFCERCSSKHIILGLYLKLVDNKLSPAVAGICSECSGRVAMPPYKLEEFIIEDLADYSYLNPLHYSIARAYPVEELVEIDSRGSADSFCCMSKHSIEHLKKENALKCHACGAFHNPIHVVEYQYGYSREEAVAFLVKLQYSRVSLEV